MYKPVLLGEGPAVSDAVLAGLRAIHPKADCIWVPGTSDRGLYYEVGIWYEPDQTRTRIANTIIARERKKPEKYQKPGKIRWARYVLNGWRPVFGIRGRSPNQQDVEEFRRRDHNYRTRFNEELKQRLRDAERLDEKAEIEESYRDHIHQFCVEEYPYISRCRNQTPFDGYAKRFGTHWQKESNKEESCSTSDEES